MRSNTWLTLDNNDIGLQLFSSLSVRLRLKLQFLCASGKYVLSALNIAYTILIFVSFFRFRYKFVLHCKRHFNYSMKCFSKCVLVLTNYINLERLYYF